MDSPSFSSASQPSITRWLRLSSLGSGSFGHVSLALNLLDGTLFAVKSASASPSSRPALLALQNELHILQSLHSPTIVRCLGADFSTDGAPQPAVLNLFLEYMDSGSLADAVRQSGGKLPQELLVRRYTRSILQGLAYLHQNGVVHCDIKCQNILIGSSGIKIADFASARRLGEASPMDGNIRGTPLWMAPEVAQGMEAMPASDIWSLGCTIVEMLQGRPPWGPHVSSLAAALFKLGCSKDNPPLPDSLSAQAKDFLLNCLNRDPEARWTAAQLLQHPFVCSLQEAAAEADEYYLDQPSPRSTLDFLHSDDESDWEEDSTMGSVSTLCFPPICVCEKSAEKTNSPAALISFSHTGNWITVKCREGWSEDRQAPFMQAGGAAGEALQAVKRGCKVSLASAEFLRNRASMVVG